MSRYEFENWFDDDGNPAGGFAAGTGLNIMWQEGPLGRGPDRKEPNGAFIEDVIEICIERLLYYQSSRFACVENADALDHLEKALSVLHARTADREARRVEGLHEL